MTTSPASQPDDLVERVRRILSPHPSVREVRMFGGLSFMVSDRLAVSARRFGDLLVSVDPADYHELLERGGEPAVMGSGRPMGRGWMVVPGARLHDDETLEFWIGVGIHSRT